MGKKPGNDGVDMTGFRDPNRVRAGLNRLAEQNEQARRDNAGYRGDGGVSYGENQRIDEGTRERARASVQDRSRTRPSEPESATNIAERMTHQGGIAAEDANRNPGFGDGNGLQRTEGQRIADGMEHGAGRFVADADRREGNSRLHAAFDQVAHQTEQPKPEMPRQDVAAAALKVTDPHANIASVFGNNMG
jgi:hypothetical protein